MTDQHTHEPHDDEGEHRSRKRGERRRSILDGIEDVMEDVQHGVRVMVCKVSGTAETVGENVRGTIKETLHGVRSARDSVVMIRVNKESLARIDDLCEAGVANSRSEAAAFLIAEGIKGRQDLFDKISEKIEIIRNAREELRHLVEDDESETPESVGDSSPTSQTD